MATIRIKVSYGGVIKTGEYQNVQPNYEVEINFEQEVDVKVKIDELNEICRNKFEEERNRILGTSKEPEVYVVPTTREDTNYDIQKKMNVITAISQCQNIEALKKIGQDIAKKIKSYSPEAIEEIKKEFNDKKRSLDNE